MQEAYKVIMQVVGLMTLLTAAITIITFLVWVIKLEFEWFFGLNIFKWFGESASNLKIKFASKLVPIKMGIDRANSSGKIKVVKKNVRLNEDME